MYITLGGCDAGGESSKSRILNLKAARLAIRWFVRMPNFSDQVESLINKHVGLMTIQFPSQFCTNRRRHQGNSTTERGLQYSGIKTRLICIIIVLLLASFTFPTAVNGQSHRMWYNSACVSRIDAAFVSVDNEQVVLRDLDGQIVKVQASSLSVCDQSIIKAYKLSTQAIAKLSESPYTSVEFDRNKTAGNLEAYGLTIPTEHSTIQQPYARRKLEDLRGGWIEFNEIPYRVANLEIDPDSHAVKQIIVNIERGGFAKIPLDENTKITTLPHVRWTYGRWKPGENPFRRRGPPILYRHAEEDLWKYELVFDTVDEVWTDSKSREAHLLIATALEELKEHERLLRPTEGHWHFAEGRRCVARQELQLALQHFSTALDRIPEFPAVFVARALLYERFHKIDAALADLDQAIEIELKLKQSNNSSVATLLSGYVARARIRSSQSYHAGAVSDAQQAVVLNTDKSDERYAALLFKVSLTAAIENARIAKSVLHRYQSGESVTESQFDLAVSAAEDAAKYNPVESDTSYQTLLTNCRRSSAQHLAFLAESQRRERNLPNAIALLEKGEKRFHLEENSNRLQAYRVEYLEQRIAEAKQYAQRSRQSIASRRYDEAVKLAQTGRNNAPKQVQSELDSVLAYALTSRTIYSHFPKANYESALADMDAYIAILPQDASGHALKGTSLWRLNRIDDAKSELGTAIQLEPENELARVVRFQILRKEASFPQAINDINTLITISPNDDRFWHWRGELYLETRDFDQALSDAQKAIVLNRNNQSHHLLEAEILEEQGKTDLALSRANAILEIDPNHPQALMLQRRLTAERSQDDHYYFDRDGLEDAAVAIGFAVAGRIAKIEGAKGIDRADSLSGALALLTIAAVGHLTEERAIEHAIQKVFPNLYYAERNILKNIIQQVFDGRIDVRTLTASSIKDAVKDMIESRSPGMVAVSTEFADLLLEINKHRQR